MLVQPIRRWAWLRIVATMLAALTTEAFAGDYLSPMPPVSANPIQSAEPLQSLDPAPGEPWFKDDQPGVSGCGCKPGCLYCPCIYGGVDYLFWNRAGTRSVPLLVDSNTGDTLVSSNQLDFGGLSGVRAWFGMRCGTFGALEFGYLNYFDANSTLQTSTTDFPGATLALPGDLGGASNVFQGTDRIRVNYGSQFNSYEINFASCCVRSCAPSCGSSCSNPPIGSIEWLAGFRYLSLNEQLNIYGERDEIGGTETGNYNAVTTNDLYGGQLGVRMRKCWGRFSGEALAKAGIFANQATQSQYVLDFPDFYLRDPVSSSHTNLAFAGEFALTGIYQINKNWGLRAGYSLLWLQGVALAPNQLDYTFTPDSGKTLHNDSGLVLHGVHLGVEARW